MLHWQRNHAEHDLVVIATQSFSAMLLLSLLLHLAGLVLLPHIPKEKALPPFKELRIRFGRDDMQVERVLGQAATPPISPARERKESISSAPPKHATAKQVVSEASNTSHLTPKPAKNPLASASKQESATAEASAATLPAPESLEKQEDTSAPSPAQRPARAERKAEAKGSAVGNSVRSDAVDLTRYEQLLPLWLNKHRQYPEEAKLKGLEGRGLLFIKINRQGKVLFASIARSTGHEVLDDALLEMVSASDPVIPVPKDYEPEKQVFAYKIEFNFILPFHKP